MTPSDREVWLRGVISKISGNAMKDVSNTEDLQDAVGLDSLGRLEVLAEIEDKFDFFFDDLAMASATSIQLMQEAIGRHLTDNDEGPD